MTSERSACPRCGAPRSVSDPESPCPACLMRLALGPNAVSPAADRTSGSSTEASATAALPPNSTAPSIEELTALFPEMEIRELIGRGGMGAVYLARQKSLDRLVALKIIRADAAADPGFAERFAREARALARLSHPHVVTVHDYGERQGTHYLVMEYVKGANVRQLLKAGRLDPQAALAIVPPICDALQYAHEEGIVHRDIKPENLLVDERGRVKIADFGLAKLVKRTPAEVTLTGDYQTLGTLHYMAPEQLERPLEVDHRADIYALGVTLYEMLTGELPLGRYALPSRKSSVDARMDEVVLRAMEREPALRYQSAYDVKSDVVAYSSSPLAYSSSPLAYSASPLAYSASPLAYSSSVANVPVPQFAHDVRPPNPSFDSAPTEEHLIPGIALTFVGMLVVFVHVGTFLMMTLSLRPPDAEIRFVSLGLALFGLPMILGGVLCARSRGYELAVFGALTAMLPVSTCLPLSLPIGIWTLIVLRRRSVREAFVQASRATPPLQAAFHASFDELHLANAEPSYEHVPPGIALAAAGGLIAVSHLAFCAYLIHEDVGQPDWPCFLPLIGVAFALPMVVGGVLCATSRSYEMATVATFLALLPTSFCLPLTLPLGVWAAVALHRPRVRAAFAAQQSVVGWLTKRKANEPPSKPETGDERPRRLVGPFVFAGAGIAFAVFGCVGWMAVYQALSSPPDSSAPGDDSPIVVAPFVDPVHRGIVRDVVVSRDGRFQLSVGDDGRIVWKDREESDLWRSYTVEHDEGGPAILRDAAIAPDGKVAYVTGETGMSRILRVDLVTRQVDPLPIRRMENFRGLAVAADGRTISYVVGDTSFAVTEISSNVTFATAEIYHGDQVSFGNVRRIASSPDGGLTALTSSNVVPGKEPGVAAEPAEPCQLSVFDRQGEEILNWIFSDFDEFSYAQIAFLDDRTLVAALPSGRLKKWTIENGAWSLSSIGIPARRHTAAAADFDGRHLWLAHDRKVAKMDAETGKIVALVDVPIGSKVGERDAEPIEALSSTLDPHVVDVACWDGTVQTVVCEPIE